jgi:beta-ureidopropionase / N-carbamoyl-L-amino-acid hydrolase
MASDSIDLAAAVDASRLWSRLMEMAKIGATVEGGVNRQAFSKEDIEARRLLTSWSRERGYELATDAIGNIFVRRRGREPGAPIVLTGSHLDSQPSGGRFDGVFGVLAGFEVLEALDDVGLETNCPIEVVAWSNEEGSRFQPGAMGSMVFAGSCRLEDLRGVIDRSGISLFDALEETHSALPDLPRRGGLAPLRAYVEAHIEQGPRLEGAGSQIGVVTGIQGTRWFNVEVRGASAHAGTTPRHSRADALQDAISAIAAMRSKFMDPDDALRFTVGRFDVTPNSPNTVPERVVFSVDLRHPDAEVLAEAAAVVPEICHAAMETCTVTVTQTFGREPYQFPEEVVQLVESSTYKLGFDYLRMPSGAFHDALFIADICPTGMIFVPCENGISHNPAENAKPEHIAAGTRVLAEVLVRLATSNVDASAN